MSVTDLPAWQDLISHEKQMRKIHMRELFMSDPNRFQKFSIRFNDLLFDYSKNRITEETMFLLFNLADQTKLRESIEDMFSGKKINTTENRSVLHIALRNKSDRPVYSNGKDIMPKVNAVLAKIRTFSEAVRTGEWKGCTGHPITDVVNIGIGGSDLGPRMVTYALKPYGHHRLRVHFISNVDPTDLTETLKNLKPETTLFLIASKSFTTQETMINAKSAQKWFTDRTLGKTNFSKHFVAVSANEKVAREFGIDENNIFPFWDWVGGRYSLWSAVGLSVVLYIGMDNFEKLLEGAHKVDEHFRTTPFDRNIPVIMGLLGIWYNNFQGAKSHAILPYDEYLIYFTDFLQQLDMESNGKSVTKSGSLVDYETGPILWGSPGTNGQHAFYQLLHQGTKLVPCDFLIGAKSHNPINMHHTVLIANFLAQTEALMKGKTLSEAYNELKARGHTGRALEILAANKTFEGNRPTNSFLYKKLTPETLGMLIALYEHKIFTQGIIWNINSFDQAGVDLGKELAEKILPELKSNKQIKSHDSSTNGLINTYKNMLTLQN